jgi:hypothetical protein
VEYAFKSMFGDDWKFDITPAEKSSYEMWLYLSVGPLHGGVFVTREQCISIANTFLTAAQQAEET